MKKILVVDDNEDILNTVKRILISHGFDVQTYSSGLNVPDIVINYEPNLILLDIHLPDKLGTEVCKEIKEINSNLPVILFSAHSNKSEALSSCAADDFIQKPFDMKHLLDTVNLHVN